MESKVIVLILVVGLTMSAKAHVALDSPSGGETFFAGQVVMAQWHETVAHNTLNWDLYFSSDEGNTWEIVAADIPFEVLSYAWTVPQVYTTQGRIRVVQDNTEMDYNDFSENFTIVPGPPQIEIEAQDLSLECNPNNETTINAWLGNHGGASVTSFCGNVTWTNDFTDLSDDCGSTGSALVAFTVTDSCGLSSITYATVEVTDNNTPVIQAPAQSMTVQCDGSGNTGELNAWLANHGGAVSADDCGTISWSHALTTQTGNCGSTNTFFAVFTVSDECGNSNITSATFTTEDNTPPDIIMPAQSMIVNCDLPDLDSIIQLWLDSHGGSNAADLCGAITWINDFTPLVGDCEATIIPVIFTATDACGNSSTTSATLELTDVNTPTIHIPAQSITVECDGAGNIEELNAWLSNHGGASSSEGCGDITWSHTLTMQTDDCGASFSAISVFTVTDACGNTSSTDASFTAEDTSVPNILIPAQNISVNCDMPSPGSVIQSWLDNHGGSNAFDICGEITWIDDFSSLNDTCDAAIIPVNFSAIDACGNINSTTAILTIEETSGIIALSEYLDFNVFPNPAKANLHIEFGEDRETFRTLQLFDVMGNVIWSNRGNTKIWDIQIAEYSDGIYLLKVTTAQGLITRKVVFQSQ